MIDLSVEGTITLPLRRTVYYQTKRYHFVCEKEKSWLEMETWCF